MSRSICILMLFGIVVAGGCEQKPTNGTPGKTTSEDVRHDVGKAISTVGEYSQQVKEEFQKKLESQLKDLDSEMSKLHERGRDLKDDAKVQWDKTMADLEVKRGVARAKLAEVGSATAEAWKDVQKGAQSAWDDLNKAFKDASR